MSTNEIIAHLVVYPWHQKRLGRQHRVFICACQDIRTFLTWPTAATATATASSPTAAATALQPRPQVHPCPLQSVSQADDEFAPGLKRWLLSDQFASVRVSRLSDTKKFPRWANFFPPIGRRLSCLEGGATKGKYILLYIVVTGAYLSGNPDRPRCCCDYLECLAAKRPLRVIESRLHSSVQSTWPKYLFTHFLAWTNIFLRWGVFRLP
jgi:hypothetical protein